MYRLPVESRSRNYSSSTFLIVLAISRFVSGFTAKAASCRFARYAKACFCHRRTRSLPIPWDRFNSESVASIPARILYRSFHSAVCWMANI